MVKVSVVIPVYNEEKYLYECLESIRMQTLQEIEVILVDDGSTDSSVDIIHEYIRKDSRFLLKQQKNLYAGIARNNGMKDAKGEYIIFLDADDFFIDTMLEELYSKAKQTDADMVICDAYNIDCDTRKISEPSCYLKSEYLLKEKDVFSYKDIPERIYQITTPAPWNKFIKTELIPEANVEFQGTKRANDVFFISIILAYAKKIAILDKRLLYYRMNNINSLQGMNVKENISYDFYTAYIAVGEELKNRRIYETVSISLINQCWSSCYSFIKRQKYLTNFSNIYHFLKDKAFKELNIQKLTSESFYSGYEEYLKIMKYNPDEYLFDFYLKNQEFRDGFIISYSKIGNAKNIAIYGAGEVGKSYWNQLTRGNHYNIVAWFDRDYKKYEERGLPVIDPENISKFDFDIIIIALEDKFISKSVYNYIKEQGISDSKIIYGIE